MELVSDKVKDSYLSVANILVILATDLTLPFMIKPLLFFASSAI
jgi:hypothetical protein